MPEAEPPAVPSLPADAEAEFWAAHRRARTPATHAIAAVIGAVFVLETLWGGSDSVATLYRMGANVPERNAEQPWRLLSSAFLHIGVMHLVFNVSALLALGGFLERVIGSARFLLLYAGAAAGGGVTSALLSTAGLSAGASGAVWGLMGAELALTVRRSTFLPEGVRQRARQAAWPPLLLNLAISFMPGIDLWAHLGGGVAGAVLMALGLLDPAVRGGSPRAGLVVKVAAAGAVVALVGALAWGWVVERPWEPLDAMRLLEISRGEWSSPGSRG